MKIYLSGPMESDPNHKEKFAAATTFIREAGHTVFSPTETGQHCWWYGWNDDKEWAERRREIMESNLSDAQRRCWLLDDIVALYKCQAIMLLDGWESSRGCRAEVEMARAVSMPVLSYFEFKLSQLARLKGRDDA